MGAKEENGWLWLLLATTIEWDKLCSHCSGGGDAVLGCGGSVTGSEGGGTGIGLVLACRSGSGLLVAAVAMAAMILFVDGQRCNGFVGVWAPIAVL